jgi:hypothetical protein
MVHSNVTSLGGTDVVDDSVVDVLCWTTAGWWWTDFWYWDFMLVQYLFQFDFQLINSTLIWCNCHIHVKLEVRFRILIYSNFPTFEFSKYLEGMGVCVWLWVVVWEWGVWVWVVGAAWMGCYVQGVFFWEYESRQHRHSHTQERIWKFENSNVRKFE